MTGIQNSLALHGPGMLPCYAKSGQAAEHTFSVDWWPSLPARDQSTAARTMRSTFCTEEPRSS
jgi:hypothetical protein